MATTLAAGGTATATIALDAFASVTVVADGAVGGTLTFTSSAPNLLSNKVARLQNKTYGPYGVPGTVTISVTAGSMTYAINSATGGLAYDSSGNITGLVGAGGVTVQIGSAGLRTVLFGDSLTDWYHTIYVPSAASISGAEITFTTSTVHGLWVGAFVYYFNYSYPALRNGKLLAVTSIVSTTQFKVSWPSNPGIATGALSGVGQLRLNTQHSVANPITMLQMRLGWPLNIVKNAAQSGEYSTGGLARLATEVLAYNPQLVIMNAFGINDQTYSGADAPSSFNSEATTIANNESIYSQILATGAYLIVGTCMPTGTGDARGVLTYCDRLERLNDALWRFARGKPRMMVVDTYGSIVDPASSVGAANTTWLRSDQVHWSIKGAVRVAALYEAFVTPLINNARSTLPKSLIHSHDGGAVGVTSASGSGTTVTVTTTATHFWRVGETIRVTGMADSAANGVFSIATVPASNQFTYVATGLTTSGAISGTKIISRSNNVFRNGLLNTASGGSVATITGTAAAFISVLVTGTTAGYTGVASVSADDSGFGNKQVIAVTACNADGTATTRMTVTGTTAYATETAPNGRYYLFECYLRLKSTSWSDTPLSDVRAQLTFTMSDGNTYEVDAFNGWDGVETGTITANQSWHVRTPPIYLPVGLTITSSVFLIWAKHSAAITNSATFTMEMARPQVVDVTDTYDQWL